MKKTAQTAKIHNFTSFKSLLFHVFKPETLHIIQNIPPRDTLSQIGTFSSQKLATIPKNNPKKYPTLLNFALDFRDFSLTVDLPAMTLGKSFHEDENSNSTTSRGNKLVITTYLARFVAVFS